MRFLIQNPWLRLTFLPETGIDHPKLSLVNLQNSRAGKTENFSRKVLLPGRVGLVCMFPYSSSQLPKQKIKYTPLGQSEGKGREGAEPQRILHRDGRRQKRSHESHRDTDSGRPLEPETQCAPGDREMRMETQTATGRLQLPGEKSHAGC